MNDSLYRLEYYSVFEKWVRVGVNFPSFEACSEEPLIEDLIAQTSIVGRYEPRLIEGMAGWLQKHGDLLNTSLMHKHIAVGDSAVIGLLSDILDDSKETLKLKQLVKYCSPKKNGEMLFFSAELSPSMKAQAIENETELNRRWNLYYVSLRIKSDAVHNRRTILKNNHNLARRALFGTEMRTEILNYLLSRKSSFPAEISRVLGYRYHRVMEDIHNLVRDGTLIEKAAGKRREIAIAPAFANYLNSIPF